MENNRNELEIILKQSNELWLQLYSECTLQPSGGCLNQRNWTNAGFSYTKVSQK